jgi:hypothetical protein
MLVKRKPKYTIEDMRKMALLRGGECLSEEYVDSQTRLQWKCAEGHTFYATPGKILRGRWCRVCGNKKAATSRRTGMEEIRSIATSHNGRCLTEEYDPKKKIEWQCQFGHKWEASIQNVKKGSWCPICARGKGGRKRLTLDDMKRFATNLGGVCLSEEYTNSDTKLKWRCKNGHEWGALPLSVKKGHWCPVCSGHKILDLEKLKRVANDRGGKCLSKSYEGNHKKYAWQCSEGHVWFATYSNIYTGTWCPECSSGIGERLCRAFFEQLFMKPFSKTRPPWLINDDGFQMELDGYCEELSLAFEHQGRQHREFTNYFYDSASQFEKRKFDDAKKRALCKQHGITLIEVPQIPYELYLPKVQEFLIKTCEDNGIVVPLERQNIKIQIKEAFSPSSREKVALLHEIAIAKGGECLSTIYISSNEKLRFRCKNNHEWETTPGVIFKGHWCPICSSLEHGKARRLTIVEMQQLALDRGGNCLSTEYINANERLLWECSSGHQWLAIPNSIKRGSWCPICAKSNLVATNKKLKER